MAVGLTVTVVPLPNDVPLHAPEYQYQFAPVPKLPPDNVKVEEPFGQTATGEALAVVAAVDIVFKVTVAVTQVVLPQVPSALT